jgi:ribosome-associated translation inhibitor RaiA
VTSFGREFSLKKEADVEKGRNCEIKLSLPGLRIHASLNEGNLHAAIAETMRDLVRQIYKQKNNLFL